MHICEQGHTNDTCSESGEPKFLEPDLFASNSSEGPEEELVSFLHAEVRNLLKIAFGKGQASGEFESGGSTKDAGIVQVDRPARKFKNDEEFQPTNSLLIIVRGRKPENAKESSDLNKRGSVGSIFGRKGA